MKKYLFVLLIVVAGCISSAGQDTFFTQEQYSHIINSSNNLLTINNLDSVVFDLSQAVDSLNYVWFPVSILSDDSVYSLDFSFKYNHSKLVFDSIIDRTNYIQFLSYYNGADSTVRFTCNSLQQYTNDTILVFVRFMTLGGPIINSDLNTIDVYLNGTTCSLKFISAIIDEVGEVKKESLSVIYFPNPVNDVLTVVSEKNVVTQIFDVKGRLLYDNPFNISGKMEFDLRNFKNGIYFLIIRDDFHVESEKFLINR